MPRTFKLPTNLLATRQEIEAARSGSNPALTLRYIEHLEAIAQAALEVDYVDQHSIADEDFSAPLGDLHEALGKVYPV